MSKVDEVKQGASVTEQPDVNNEIKETTGSEMEIYEDYDTTDLSDSAGKKKKFKKRYVVIGIAALALIGIIAGALNSRKNSVVYVETYTAAPGAIENVISISGTVQSADSKSYFSDVTAPIEKINVKVGDKVKAGDVLYTFDQEALDLAQNNAELAIKQAKGSYSATVAGATASSSAQNYANTMTLAQINDRIDQITNDIEAVQKQITEKQNRINQTIDELRKVQMDYNQNRVTDSAEGYAATDRKDSDGNEMYLQTQEALTDATAALTRDPEIIAWQDQITALKDEATRLGEAKSLKVSGGSVQSAKAALDTTQLNQEDTLSKIEEARAGVSAEFNGVVTAIPANVVDGATVTAGSMVVTLANLDEVQVAIQVSKSDLPKISVGQKVDVTINNKTYEGEISKISGTATKNANGVAVVDTVIVITNPDDEIILGVEANNKIHAEKAENTIVLPYEYIQTDATGDYVLVVDNGIVTRKDVTIGISTSTDAEITEGLSVGDAVISSDVSLLTEGMAVQVQ
ncbi:MAG: efflux RND transporter periplasmic adaptor subunit [Butyrivibrio sp.]|nr:efflux RND transporter periplasmic adaptor subunit [Butyrivibrio sp.]